MRPLLEPAAGGAPDPRRRRGRADASTSCCAGWSRRPGRRLPASDARRAALRRVAQRVVLDALHGPGRRAPSVARGAGARHAPALPRCAAASTRSRSGPASILQRRPTPGSRGPTSASSSSSRRRGGRDRRRPRHPRGGRSAPRKPRERREGSLLGRPRLLRGDRRGGPARRRLLPARAGPDAGAHRRYLPPSPQRVLDVGGAAGAYAYWLAERGHEVHLVDPVAKHLRQAEEAAARRPKILASIREGDARALPFEDASADAVLMLGPLYHLHERADRLKALREAARVLRAGGWLFAAGDLPLRLARGRTPHGLGGPRPALHGHRGPGPARRPAPERDRQHQLLHDLLLPPARRVAGRSGGGRPRGKRGLRGRGPRVLHARLRRALGAAGRPARRCCACSGRSRRSPRFWA